ncbi:major facilitator superfamily domain-containing protein [Gilbertella persicaria]|uniref:major facilitator superfamily domain-containing protein n=1 Tax=Gilbertella persicaria TaxID=101096 RepID=UPI002220AF87|nr:major facilitator superfamily domain-containing protein [Gilbertella persicaria]KAI8065348.1 major facilitator superfamily domain-containing protein [Gilbertella persicaria]
MVTYLLPKLLYVCLYSVLGSAIPYLSLFYADVLHLPSQQIGIILAIAPFIQSLACPFWTYQVDKRPEWHGRLMAILMFIGGFSILGLMFIPLFLTHGSQSSVLLITVALAVTFAFFGQPVTVLVDSAVLKILGDNAIYYGDQRLWGSVSNGVCILLVGYFIGLFGINCAFYIFGVSVVAFIIMALFTRVTYVSSEETIENEPLLQDGNKIKGFYTMDPTAADETDHAGNGFVHSDMQRVTSIANTLLTESGAGGDLHLQRTVTSLAVRDVQDEANELLDHMDNLPPLGLALSHIPTVDTSLAAFASIVEESELAEVGPSLKHTIFGSVKVWTFLLMSLLFGVFYSMIAQFLFLFLKQDLKLDSSVIGWTGPLGGITEVSTFYVSRLLSKKFSVESLVTVAHLTIILRNYIYEILQPGHPSTTIIALALQLLNGFSYALIWSTCVSEVDQMFPTNQRAIAQGLLASFFNGIGFGLGCILGGFAYDHYGAAMLFNLSIAVSLISLIVFWSGRLLKSP